ncbi:prolyl oligopeptidase family serine peptidase [Muricauda ruestringensis]|uniref:alpha/beta hydrolase family protein n=1 Tax=Flagellimonas ruestringensis TaxID=111501 RepID=UPI001CD6C4C8|nr:prolyl oligopeptidase family serine peptidase [Allomuricauda ruestringensis]MCA0958543.1 prolyl oligopeptidase family serine peptidase [Allomuricauda ruestringensis]
MKKLLLLLLLIGSIACAQDGKIISKEALVVSDSIRTRLAESVPELDAIQFSKITYLSDGLKVTGYIAEPKKEGKYPCIISNRGGNREFGEWNPLSVAFFMGKMASWGYIVVASQYRGNDGGEGIEQFGGDDINDVLNLMPVLEQLPKADTARIGIEGGSRGGMMTYLAMKESCRFKAAAAIAGMADAHLNIKNRPEMEKHVFSELAPNYWADKENQLNIRSAVLWADKMCKTTPLLVMHGSADWRVSAEESLSLVSQLYKYKHPTRFILFEGADHGIREYREDMFHAMKNHFDRYVRDESPLPNMEPHGR